MNRIALALCAALVALSCNAGDSTTLGALPAVNPRIVTEGTACSGTGLQGMNTAGLILSWQSSDAALGAVRGAPPSRRRPRACGARDFFKNKVLGCCKRINHHQVLFADHLQVLVRLRNGFCVPERCHEAPQQLVLGKHQGRFTRRR